jgi:4-hydroxybenzoate polyprenyltransferase
MHPDGSTTMDRWRIFIHERFPIAEHALSIFLLTLGNGAVACAITGREFHAYNFAIACTVCLLFFFRLRCFDEIKDYATDRSVNPDRPLARGLLTITEVKTMFVAVTVAELALVSLLGPPALLAHLLAVAYSYLMYKEFYIGRYLSPHLTTYALTHTLVSVLVAYSVFCQMTGLSLLQLNPDLLVFGLASWCIFNLFEFGRKTFAPDEERQNVPTYTTTFGVLGAVTLSVSQIVASVALMLFIAREDLASGLAALNGHLIAAAIPPMAGVLFYVLQTRRAARWFRAACSGYLLVYYALISYQGFTGAIAVHAS